MFSLHTILYNKSKTNVTIIILLSSSPWWINGYGQYSPVDKNFKKGNSSIFWWMYTALYLTFFVLFEDENVKNQT